MTRNELNDAYFDWMYRLVCTHDRYYRRKSYRSLLRNLYETPFDYTIPMDGNRADDGVNLRYRFGYACDYDQRMIADYLDDRQCSILEMMVALSQRIEEQFMRDPEFGDRTGVWFWQMIENLGLTSMYDEKYRAKYVSRILRQFLDREYERDGWGGLFCVKYSDVDFRTLEIWDQMCMYIEELE